MKHIDSVSFNKYIKKCVCKFNKLNLKNNICVTIYKNNCNQSLNENIIKYLYYNNKVISKLEECNDIDMLSIREIFHIYENIILCKCHINIKVYGNIPYKIISHIYSMKVLLILKFIQIHCNNELIICGLNLMLKNEFNTY